MKTCIVCGKSYTNPGKRCNSCRNKAWKLANHERDLEQRRAYNHRRWEKVKPILSEKHCKNCNKVFLPNRKTPYQPYCSSNCRILAYRERAREVKKNWRLSNPERYKEQQRISDANYKDKLRFSGNRLKVLERDNHACKKCGNKGPRLNIHHKDFSGQTDNPNNKMSNLITLCAACHIRIHTHQIS